MPVKDKVTVDLMPLLRRAVEDEDKDYSCESEKKQKERIKREIQTSPLKIRHTAKSLAVLEKMKAEKQAEEVRNAKTKRLSNQMEGRKSNGNDTRRNVNILNVRFDLKQHERPSIQTSKTNSSEAEGNMTTKVQPVTAATSCQPRLSIQGVEAKKHHVEEKGSKVSPSKPLKKSKLGPKRTGRAQRQEAKKPPWR